MLALIASRHEGMMTEGKNDWSHSAGLMCLMGHERLETVGPYSLSKVLVVMGMGKQLIVH